MKSWKCDHCGGSVSANRITGGRGVAGPDNWVTVAVTPVGRNKVRQNERFDLCSDCWVQLQSFLTKSQEES